MIPEKLKKDIARLKSVTQKMDDGPSRFDTIIIIYEGSFHEIFDGFKAMLLNTSSAFFEKDLDFLFTNYPIKMVCFIPGWDEDLSPQTLESVNIYLDKFYQIL